MSLLRDSRSIGYGLARALAAAPDEPRAARAHLVRALGRDWAWLAGMQRGVRQRFGAHGGEALAARLDELAAFLSTRASLLTALRYGEEKPRLVGHFTFHPRMARAPAAMGSIALPALGSAGDLARWLELSVEELTWFAGTYARNGGRLEEALRHYRYRWVPKRNGGVRLLEIPKPRLAAMQRRLLDELLYFVRPHEAAHGFRPRHSPLSHAAVHVGQAAVLRMDLRDFFVSVPASRVHAMFHALGYPTEVARLLAGLTCNLTPKAVLRERMAAMAADPAAWRTLSRFYQPHLPQGAPTSPALANLCAFRLDLRLAALADDAGLRYTRYADDLAFSGGRELARGIDRFKSMVAAIAAAEGFAVNPGKTRLMLQAQRQQLTGVVVNARVNTRRDDYERLKAVLHNCARHGPAAQNREQVPDFRAHLMGRIAHVRRLNPARGARLAADFAAIVWPG